MTDTNSTSEPNSANGSSSGSGPFVPKSPNEALKPERVPEPPRRSRKARSQLVIFLNFLMTLIVLVSVVAVAAFYYVISAYQQPGPLATNTHFVVPDGAGLAQISQMLERNGIVSDARVFRYMTASYLHKEQTLKAGEYEIKAGMSMKDIALLLESGKSILYSVSMPEGLTVQQMVKRLADDPVLEGPVPNELPPEGSLRPDTYKFSRGTTRGEILAQMRAAQEKLIDQIWAKRDPDLPIKTKQEFVTLASIVEKETGKDDERAHVASVFMNRLNKGMRLQSDPTILYGLFGGAGRPADRPIMRSDIDKQTPFNTYQIKGLPPTPIANPGRAALEAVANPWRTNDLYFVADGTGGHAFAATLDEHNANVRRWRKIEAERANASGDTLNGGSPGGADAEKPPKGN
ncbi:endolytic transglycosylase MltG [Rhizobium sp. FKY42]|uniref:endolytic transglycosylase MltG n=1 Tax=Rhizobium sp. FKY42 TaxID=2562310 RepID=UPI0010BFE681|nr:endolytic transglycosylase MltG [Rhizobium sp. FKY42]